MEAQSDTSAANEAVRVPLGAGGFAKIRNPLLVFFLDLITVGIYGVIWFYYVNRELALLGRTRNTTELGENPTKSLLALFPGLIIIVPAVITLRNTVRRLQTAQAMLDVPDEEHASVPLGTVLLFFLPPVGSYYFQKRLNGVWHVVSSVDAAPVSELA